jgi:hypothetical protein
MAQIKIIGEIEGFDRVLYESVAKWDGFSLSVVTDGKAQFQISIDNIDSIEQTPDAIRIAQEKIERFTLSAEWATGCELKYTIHNIDTSDFASTEELLVLKEQLRLCDFATAEIPPKPIPAALPQIPLEAERWIRTWIESTKLNDYVEEQLRRHYLIIEELWQDNHQIFDASQRADKKSIKLIRHFVSHESCKDPEVVALIENDLPSAVVMLNGAKHVRFNRTTEHRNYIARFEVKAREIARALVDRKMRQLGVVSSV